MSAEQNPKSRLIAIVGAATAAALLLFTPKFEGEVLITYKDIGGVLTYCDGATENAQWGRTYTVAECRAQLERDLARHAEGISKCLPWARLTDGQKVAYTDAAYNIGVSAFCGSSMARRANAGDMTGACDALLMWDKVQVLRPVLDQSGHAIKGPDGKIVMHKVAESVAQLARRRQAERELCVRGLP